MQSKAPFDEFHIREHLGNSRRSAMSVVVEFSTKKRFIRSTCSDFIEDAIHEKMERKPKRKQHRA